MAHAISSPSMVTPDTGPSVNALRTRTRAATGAHCGHVTPAHFDAQFSSAGGGEKAPHTREECGQDHRTRSSAHGRASGPRFSPKVGRWARRVPRSASNRTPPSAPRTSAASPGATLTWKESVHHGGRACRGGRMAAAAVNVLTGPAAAGLGETDVRRTPRGCAGGRTCPGPRRSSQAPERRSPGTCPRP